MARARTRVSPHVEALAADVETLASSTWNAYIPFLSCLIATASRLRRGGRGRHRRVVPPPRVPSSIALDSVAPMTQPVVTFGPGSGPLRSFGSTVVTW